jgi:hypothetical protein
LSINRGDRPVAVPLDESVGPLAPAVRGLQDVPADWIRVLR